MAEVEKVARELLAAEEDAEYAKSPELKHLPPFHLRRAALRAIQAAYLAGLVEAKGAANSAQFDTRGSAAAAIQARIDEG